MKVINLKNIHPLIYQRLLEINKEQRNYPLFDTMPLDAAFNWDKTVETWHIWNYVEEWHFDPWYVYHGLPNPENPNPNVVKQIKVNELFLVEGFGYMFTKPDSPLTQTNEQGLILMHITELP